MVTHPSNFIGAVLAALTVSTAALAQSYYDDQACRQFADVLSQNDSCEAAIPGMSGTNMIGSASLGNPGSDWAHDQDRRPQQRWRVRHLWQNSGVRHPVPYRRAGP